MKRPSSILSGFTLVELLIVVSIIGILSGTVLAVVQGATSRARTMREVSAARQVTAGYLLHAADHNDELLLGYQESGSITYPNGDQSSGPEANRYPWRLAPSINWNIDGVYLVNEAKRAVQQYAPNTFMYRYQVSLTPALGLNAYCVGGYQSGGGMFCANDVTTRLAQVDRPASLIAFVSARSKTSAGQYTGDFAGSHYVRPPSLGGMRWTSGAFDPTQPSSDFGNVDFRNAGQATVSFLDGSVRMMTPDQLRDMRLWARNANSADYAPNL